MGIGKTWDTPETAVLDYFRAALSIDDADFCCLDYAQLSAHTLPAILDFFHLDSPPGQLKLMAAEFTWDAKSGRVPKPFVPRPAYSEEVSDGLKAAWVELRNHAPLQT